MAKRRALLAGRAWNLVRLTLIWARKGGAFRRGLMLGHLRLLKTLRHGGGGGNEKRVRYLEREFSFDETPAFRFRMHRPASMRLPRLPCITPSVVDLDDEDRIFFDRHRGRHFFETQDKEEDHDDDDDDDDESNIDASVGGEGSEYGDGGKVEELEGVDSQAEEFIARFYQQMKFQRQVSLLEYHEMLHRGMS